MAIKFTTRDQPAAAPAAGKKSAAQPAPIIDKEAAVAGEPAGHGTDLFQAEPKTPSRKRPRK